MEYIHQDVQYCMDNILISLQRQVKRTVPYQATLKYTNVRGIRPLVIYMAHHANFGHVQKYERNNELTGLS